MDYKICKPNDLVIDSYMDGHLAEPGVLSYDQIFELRWMAVLYLTSSGAISEVNG